MATSTVTLDENEWVYIDKFGDPHTVTNAQTFSLTVTDGGVADVSYAIPVAQSVTTTDGLTINFRPRFDINQSSYDSISPLTDAGEGSAFLGLTGEWAIECPKSGDIQIWKPASVTPSDADYGSAGTIAFTMEDQFGNSMSVTGVTVGQAS